MQDTLAATRFVDSSSPVVQEFATSHAGNGSDIARAVNLCYALRDAIAYDMRTFGLDPEQFVASNVLQAQRAFCVPKAVAMV